MTKVLSHQILRLTKSQHQHNLNGTYTYYYILIGVNQLYRISNKTNVSTLHFLQKDVWELFNNSIQIKQRNIDYDWY